MSQPIYTQDKLIICENCHRRIKTRLRFLHGEGFCSKELTLFEIKRDELKERIIKLREKLKH